MKSADQATPEKLVQMIQDVIAVGRSTGLIKGGYLGIFEDIARQVPKKHARQQFRLAQAARRAANQKNN
jgi:hypothetical protein